MYSKRVALGAGFIVCLCSVAMAAEKDADPAAPKGQIAAKTADSSQKTHAKAAAVDPVVDSLKTIAVLPPDPVLRKILTSRVTMNFKETPLSDVVDWLNKTTKLNVVLDRNGLQLANIEPDYPITLSLKDVLLVDGLDVMLEPLDLTYVTRDNILVITDMQETAAKKSTQAYPVADLIYVKDNGQMDVDASDLIEVLTCTVQPDDWEDNGGTAAVEFHAPSGSLVVRHQQRGHWQVAALLDRLRELKNKTASVAPAKPPEAVVVDVAKRLSRRREQEARREEEQRIKQYLAQHGGGGSFSSPPRLTPAPVVGVPERYWLLYEGPIRPSDESKFCAGLPYERFPSNKEADLGRRTTR